MLIIEEGGGQQREVSSIYTLSLQIFRKSKTVQNKMLTLKKPYKSINLILIGKIK